DGNLLAIYLVEARGQPDRAHAAAADAANELIRADAIAFGVLAAVVVGRVSRRIAQNKLAKLGCGYFQKFACLFRAAQEGLDFPAQFIVARAEHPEVGCAVLGGALE